MLLGVPKVVSWLVLVGVNECILIKVQMVRNSGKKWILSLFCGRFLLGSMSTFLRSCVLLGWFLRIFWPKMPNNFAVPKVRVILGPNLRVLWSKVTTNFAVPKIRVILGLNLRVLWSKVMTNFAVPKIHVLGELSCWGRNLK